MSDVTCDLCGAPGDGSEFCRRCGQRMPVPAAGNHQVSQPTAPAAAAPASPPPTVTLPPAGRAATASRDAGSRKRMVGYAAVAAVILVALVLVLVVRGSDEGAATYTADDTATPGSTGAESSEDPSDTLTDPGSETYDGPEEEEGQPDVSDPLGLGYPFEDQSCTGAYLIMLASSGEPDLYESTLQPALGEQADLDPHYLRTDESCETFNQAGPEGDPIYAAYAGPFDDAREACQTRMDTTTPSTYVKALDGTTEGAYYCACSYDLYDLPDLNSETDAESSGERRFWTVELQHILFNEGFNPRQLVGGNYGPQTESMVSGYQEDRGLGVTGSMDSDTWSAMQTDTCS